MRSWQLFLGVLTVLLLMGGMPIAALISGWISGTHTVVANKGLPGEYTMIMGRDSPRPTWIPIIAAATITDGAQVLEGMPGLPGNVDLVVDKPLSDIKAFYTKSLTDLGFNVADLGIEPLNKATADYLGVAGTLEAVRPETGDFDYVLVHLTTADSWFTSARVVNIGWRKSRPKPPAALAP